MPISNLISNSSIIFDSSSQKINTQHKQLNIVDIFPGGETFLVLPLDDFQKLDLPKVDTIIMNAKSEEKLSDFQQGGVLSSPINTKSLVRLNMCYSELCLNGLRSTGYLIADQHINNGDLLPVNSEKISRNDQSLLFYIESSATKEEIQCEAFLGKLDQNTGKSSITSVSVSVPDQSNIKITNDLYPLESASLIDFGAIAHIVIPTPPPEGEEKFILQNLANQFATTANKAFGVTWLYEKNETKNIDPWVILTDSPDQIFHQRSCGSGAIAAYLHLQSSNTKDNYIQFNPPSGMPLSVSGSIDSATLKLHGPVTMNKVNQLEVPFNDII